MTTRRLVTLFIAAAAVSVFSAEAFASCKVQNRTKYDFTVTSGNTSNQKLRGRSSMSIASGTITGKSPEGKTISGSCKDGDDLVIEEKRGVPVMEHK